MKKTLTILGASLIMASSITAQATDLPDISVIGNYHAQFTDSANTFDVKEVEFSFQHYLYPGVKANIFAALHKQANGSRAFELEESYVTFSDVLDVVAPGFLTNLNLETTVGKQLVPFGKVNSLHPEQLSFVDRSFATQNFLGGEEGLSGEGAQVSTLLPLPFYSSLEVGYRTAAAHEEEAGGDHGVEYENRLLNTRLGNSFKLASNQELQFGLNYLLGNAAASDEADQQELMGLDVTYSFDQGQNRGLSLQTEYYQAKFGEEGESTRESQSGGFVSGIYKFNKTYQAGVRYGFLGKHGDEGNTKNQLSLMVMRQLTETSKFRVQMNSGENTTDLVTAQFIFGMGPHAHVLR